MTLVLLAGLAFLASMLTILSPCILPVLPFVLTRADRPFRQHGLPMLVGMVVAFTAVAALAAVAGVWAVRAHSLGRNIALGLVTLFALSMLLPAVADGLARPVVALGNRLLERKRPLSARVTRRPFFSR